MPRVDWITAADDGLCAEVHRVVHAVAEIGGAVGWLTPPDRVESDAWLTSVLAGVEAGTTRLAGAWDDDGRLQGLGYWTRLPDAVVARNAEIRKVMTHPTARGGGLGRALLRALVDDARRAEVETLVLDVRGNNHAAMALYEQEGFVAVGRLPDFIAVGQERFDRVFYRQSLHRPAGLERHGGRAEGPGASLQTPLSARR